jgi:di/tricarboxylate transporter
MTAQEWILVGVFGATIVLMFFTRLRPDLIAMVAALSLALLRVIPADEVLSGLGSSVVLTLIGLFILARGLEQTGLIRAAARRLSRVGGGDEGKVLLTLMATSALLSLFMNNVAVGALLLPASVRVARSTGVPVARLLLPVSYATLLGGMATYFTTANIIMSDLLVHRGVRPLGMVDFALTGGLVAVAGITYMLTLGRRLLPGKDAVTETPQRDLFGLYRMWERTWEFTVPRGSYLAGLTLEEAGFGEHLGLAILAIKRRGRTLLIPEGGTALVVGDSVVVLGREDRLVALGEWGIDVEAHPSPEQLATGLELTEVVILPRSAARGKTLADLKLRTRYGVMALALWREGEIIRTDVGKTPLEVGDGLLVVNLPERLKALAGEGGFLVTGSEAGAPARPERWPVALAIALGVLAVSFSGTFPIGATAFAGALAMALTGCVSMEGAYRSIEWHVIFLIAGLLPLGYAMINTGLADRIAGPVGASLGRVDPLIVVALTFVVTAALTQVVGGQVSPLLVGPVALSVADTGVMAPHALAVVVALGASSAFLTPMAHPVNAMMMGTAGYRPGHFARIGAGMTAVVLAALMAGMMLFWRIR